MTGDTERKLRGGVGVGDAGVVTSNLLAISSRAAAILFSTANLCLSNSNFSRFSCNSWSQVVSLTVVSKQLTVTVKLSSRHCTCKQGNHYRHNTPGKCKL